VTENHCSSSDQEQKGTEGKNEVTNDGVKILEEVFGKASVGDDEKEETK